MDEDELNIWYEDEKQKLLDDYAAQLEAGRDHQKTEQQFHDRMQKLTVKYNVRMEGAIRKNEKGKKFQGIIAKIRQKLHLDSNRNR